MTARPATTDVAASAVGTPEGVNQKGHQMTRENTVNVPNIEVERLREALEPFARYYDLNDLDEREPDDALEVPVRDLRRARSALSRKQEPAGAAPGGEGE